MSIQRERSVFAKQQVAEEQFPGRNGLDLYQSAGPFEVDVALMRLGDGVDPACLLVLAVEFLERDELLG